jgi:phage terminase small subunit
MMEIIKIPVRHERFCQEYIIDFNGARAARDSGFAKRSARVTASKLLTNPNIQKRIQQLMNDRSERTKITQDMVLRELAILGFSDFKHYGQIDKDGALEFYPFEKIKDEKTRAIKSMKEVSGAQSHSISLKLHSKEKPLELIGKYLGMFVDEHKLNLTGSVIFKIISAVPRPKEKEG